ncbi:MAG: YjbH domain-containing protein [Gammaproteobacteria bacterium]|nr:YjbH domain-containing protein [Gammaproteobacteria bacterium]MBU1555785.1 YjbH domain-containing protein [Gammaproteobacteria bacterium]MBU2069689.1 YjbH domain-containing protein [Gammaproteobacteria bacterium]MBU2184554.1 YjbH domain-containing protein [Gammaproteobacteria bacterium]MBU2205236.1 YjbH domain-containing protein [Gammaproteobacteria bacterium]
MTLFRLPFRLSILSLLLMPAAVCASDLSNWQLPPAGASQMAHGGVGLIQTPTARMAPAGDLSMNYTDNEEYRLWSVSIQLFDWMESTIRYTDVRTRLYSDDPSFSGDQTYKDKGIDVKFRLLQESSYLPQVSLGIRDFGGTGLFESEYLTLSKKWHNLDFHLGIGWGYLGQDGNITNPFCQLRDSFCNRPEGYGGRGGKVDYDQFFKGPASLFGGIEYQTPWQPLRLKLEYEGNNYQQDFAGNLTQDSNWNFGAVYRWGNFNFDLNYQRGNTLGFGVHYALNLHSVSQYKVKPALRPVPAQLNRTEISDRDALPRALLQEAGFALQTAHMTDDEFVIYGYQMGYRDHDEAVERIGRILATEVPAHIQRYRIVNYAGNLAAVETVIEAAPFIAAVRYESLHNRVKSSYVRQQPAAQTLAYRDIPSQNGFFAGSEVFFIQTFGNPEAFYMYQAGLFANAGYRLSNNLMLNSTAKITVLENFDKFNYTVDAEQTPLPRVRTYMREYVTGSVVSMENLYLQWQDQIAPNWFAQAYGGYLETMYGGVGTELLYRPVDSNIAVGFDLNYVRQRSYDNEFDFFDYKTFTGHINVYWKPEFLPDTQLTFNIGQFLAKDKGVNVDFAKRFNSGIVVGAYAAFTNVSAEEYGEGSFTKGFYLSIPFDLFSLRPAKGRGRLPWVPIARDGGQPLNRPATLIDMTEQRSPFYD